MDLDENQWINKYLFAVGLKSDIPPSQEPQLTMHQMATANIPLRISWISSTHIWIESRLTPRIGSNIQLKGAIASQLGLKSLSLFVEKNTTLIFTIATRKPFYVDGLSPQHNLSKKKILIKRLSENYSTKPIYVFMGMSSGDLRENIKRSLNKKHIHLHLALRKASSLSQNTFVPMLWFLTTTLSAGKTLVFTRKY